MTCAFQTAFAPTAQGARGGWVWLSLSHPVLPLLQVFSYTPGVHDVWLLPGPTCDFQAPGAEEVSTAGRNTYTAELDKAGVRYYACSIVGHCDAGMLLKVNVSAAGSTPVISRPAPVPSDEGTQSREGVCSEPTTDTATGIVSVSCLSPPVSLAPGDNIYPNIPM